MNTYRYKPSGDLLAKTGSSPDPRFLWTGDTGSRTTTKAYAEQYNRARHYGNKQGQWTTVDPLWPDERAYGYVGGSPVVWVDPTGRYAVCINKFFKAVAKCEFRPTVRGKRSFWKKFVYCDSFAQCDSAVRPRHICWGGYNANLQARGYDYDVTAQLLKHGGSATCPGIDWALHIFKEFTKDLFVDDLLRMFTYTTGLGLAGYHTMCDIDINLQHDLYTCDRILGGCKDTCSSTDLEIPVTNLCHHKKP
jgi:RHS repeat-associated protein